MRRPHLGSQLLGQGLLLDRIGRGQLPNECLLFRRALSREISQSFAKKARAKIAARSMPYQGFGIRIDAYRQLKPYASGRAKPTALRRPNGPELGKMLHGFFLTANLGL